MLSHSTSDKPQRRTFLQNIDLQRGFLYLAAMLPGSTAVQQHSSTDSWNDAALHHCNAGPQPANHPNGYSIFLPENDWRAGRCPFCTRSKATPSTMKFDYGWHTSAGLWNIIFKAQEKWINIIGRRAEDIGTTETRGCCVWPSSSSISKLKKLPPTTHSRPHKLRDYAIPQHGNRSFILIVELVWDVQKWNKGAFCRSSQGSLVWQLLWSKVAGYVSFFKPQGTFGHSLLFSQRQHFTTRRHRDQREQKKSFHYSLVTLLFYLNFAREIFIDPKHSFFQQLLQSIECAEVVHFSPLTFALTSLTCRYLFSFYLMLPAKKVSGDTHTHKMTRFATIYLLYKTRWESLREEKN